MEMMKPKSAIFEAYREGSDPAHLLCELLQKSPEEAASFEGIPQDKLWGIVFQLASQDSFPQLVDPNEPLSDLNQVYELISRANKIVVLMGAGASSGPDFRSPGGLYDSIAQSGQLDDPYDVFDLNCYSQNPEVFWRFAHLIFPSETPVYSAAHLFVEYLEKSQKLLRVYTQNVDTLEKGIPDEKLRCVHGSWRTNKCLHCGLEYSMEDLRSYVNAGAVPHCLACGGIIKPGIVFFGQPTNLDNDEVYRDALESDLLIVIGTSLKVAPISKLPEEMKNVPSILINREPVGCNFNAELLGDCTDIVHAIEEALGWSYAIEGAPEEPMAEQPILYPPNKFVFPCKAQYKTSVVETGRSMFLVTPNRIDPDEFD